MRSFSLFRNSILLAALAIAIPVLAKPMAKTLPIAHEVHFGQVDVKSGEYRVTIDDNHLTLTKGKNVIAESAGRWEERDTKPEYDEIVSNAEGKVIELRFAGKKSVFVLTQ
jgi:hypothetical protein